MKFSQRLLALLLVVVMLVSTLASCFEQAPCVTHTDGNEDKICDVCGHTIQQQPCTSHVDDNKDNKCDTCGTTISTGDGKINYDVQLALASGGKPPKGVMASVYEGDEIKALKTFDDDGKVSFRLTPSADLVLKLENLPEGYKAQSGYRLNANGTTVTITTGIIDNPGNSFIDKKLELGDIMYDFTLTDIDGNVQKLSDLLKTNTGVLINFWGTGCGNCEDEFPFMMEAYKAYRDLGIEIIAYAPISYELSTHPGATNTQLVNYIRGWQTSLELEFPLILGEIDLERAFAVTGYPTSVMIDRYGVITLVEVGALPSVKPFNALFEHNVKSDLDYEQKIMSSIGDLTPTQKPDIEQPSSDDIGAIINGTNYDGSSFEATYYPETDSSDAEYSWPFIICSGDCDHSQMSDTVCIHPSNSFIDSSFAIMHASVTLKAGEALAIDYFASSELGVDALYILVNGKDTLQISGYAANNTWKTCYPFVAATDGTYEISFVYNKDYDTDTGDDTVYLKNFRKVLDDSIDIVTYIPRYVATNPDKAGTYFRTYAHVFFNEDNGYYHVCTTHTDEAGHTCNPDNSPLLLANIMGITMMTPKSSLWYMALNGELAYENADGEEINLYSRVEEYAMYANKALPKNYCTVDAGLKALLDEIVENIMGNKSMPDYDNQWLQFCEYYDAYGTNGVQLPDPIKGVAIHSALDAVENEKTDTESYPNEFVYNRLIGTPRGMYAKFTPSVSGVYLIESSDLCGIQADPENGIEFEMLGVDGWIFDANNNIIHTYRNTGRVNVTSGEGDIDSGNGTITIGQYDVKVFLKAYLEAGVDYYINIAFQDITAFGSVFYQVRYIGEAGYDYIDENGNRVPYNFGFASDSAFTFNEDDLYDDDPTNDYELIAGGINVKYDEVAGVWKELLADGTLGSELYADFTRPVGPFSQSILTIIKNGGFDFSKSDTDTEILLLLKNTKVGQAPENPTREERATAIEKVREYLEAEWADDYDDIAKAYKLEEVFAIYLEDGEAGEYHGKSTMDRFILGVLSEALNDKNAAREKLMQLWGDDYAANYELYKVEEVFNGIYHGENKTDEINLYVEKMIDDGEAGEEDMLTDGCVLVDMQLSELLQMLIDKFSFSGVEEAWKKMCYRFEYFGPQGSSNN